MITHCWFFCFGNRNLMILARHHIDVGLVHPGHSRCARHKNVTSPLHEHGREEINPQLGFKASRLHFAQALGIDRHTTSSRQYLSKVSCQSLQSTSVGTSKLRTFHDMDTKNTGSRWLKYHEISLMLDSSSAKNGWVLFFDVVVIIKSYSVPLLGLFTTTQTYQKSHKNWLTSNIYHIPVQPKKKKSLGSYTQPPRDNL